MANLLPGQTLTDAQMDSLLALPRKLAMLKLISESARIAAILAHKNACAGMKAWIQLGEVAQDRLDQRLAQLYFDNARMLSRGSPTIQKDCGKELALVELDFLLRDPPPMEEAANVHKRLATPEAARAHLNAITRWLTLKVWPALAPFQAAVERIKGSSSAHPAITARFAAEGAKRMVALIADVAASDPNHAAENKLNVLDRYREGCFGPCNSWGQLRLNLHDQLSRYIWQCLAARGKPDTDLDAIRWCEQASATYRVPALSGDTRFQMDELFPTPHWSTVFPAAQPARPR